LTWRRSRHARGSRSRLPRSCGRAPHTSCVLSPPIDRRENSVFEGRTPCPLWQFSSALFFFDAATVHFACATSTTLVLYGSYALFGRGVTVTVSQNIALQVRRHAPTLFRWLVLITTAVSFSAFYSPKPRCRTLRNLITLH
jgi:hypothetical protein